MNPSGNSKLKLLYVMRFLLEKTDEDHTVTVQDIIDYLQSLGLTSERKSIYEYIELLQDYGLDILCQREKRNRYFVGSRDFELPELKLLVDAVQYSKFITPKKSEELIRKINGLASVHQADQLVRQVYVTNRLKAVNENIYYSVDILHNAISTKHKVSFRYFDYDLSKQRHFRKNNEKYVTIPCFMVWDDENYYLVTYNEKYDKFNHFRVDKMVDVAMSEEVFEKEIETMDAMNYSSRIFNMFGGEEMTIDLKVNSSLIGVVLDRFGHDIELRPIDDESFAITVDVVMSPTFLAWIFQFMDKIQLIGPQKAVDRYHEMLEKTLGCYQ